MSALDNLMSATAALTTAVNAATAHMGQPSGMTTTETAQVQAAADAVAKCTAELVAALTPPAVP